VTEELTDRGLDGSGILNIVVAEDRLVGLRQYVFGGPVESYSAKGRPLVVETLRVLLWILELYAFSYKISHRMAMLPLTHALCSENSNPEDNSTCKDIDSIHEQRPPGGRRHRNRSSLSVTTNSSL
jgi:hypothetical protein